MKFATRNFSRGYPRLGALQQIGKQPNLEIETPTAMLYTRGGSIPHITNEVFKIVCKTSQILQIPLQTTYSFDNALREYENGISEYIGMKGCISCVMVHDPAQLAQSGYHFKDLVPMWTRNGKVLIDSEKYMNYIESFKPDMYFLLSDGDTNISSKSKRIVKSVDNTIKYFNQCMKRHETSEVLKNSFVLASIAGGYCLQSREKCINMVTQNDAVGGYFIDGLHNNGSEVEFLPFSEIKSVSEFVINKLPAEKLRAVTGCWNPVTIIKMVQLGVDLFDTSYCHILTDRSSALTFEFDSNSDQLGYEINLHDQGFAQDFSPILPSCTCLTCTKYSRGYLHHLVTVQELLGPLLLMIHNIHHYMKFFERIRECIKENSLDLLLAKVSNQFNEFQNQVRKKEAIARPTSEQVEDLTQ